MGGKERDRTFNAMKINAQLIKEKEGNVHAT
jgi:hypothetical protein